MPAFVRLIPTVSSLPSASQMAQGRVCHRWTFRHLTLHGQHSILDKKSALKMNVKTYSWTYSSHDAEKCK